MADMAHSTQAFIMPAIAAFNMELHQAKRGGVLLFYSTAALWAQHLIPKSICPRHWWLFIYHTTWPDLAFISIFDSFLCA